MISSSLRPFHLQGVGIIRDQVQSLIQRQAARPADQAGQRHTVRDQQNRSFRMSLSYLVGSGPDALGQLKQVLAARCRDMNRVKLAPVPDIRVLVFDVFRLHALPLTQANLPQAQIYLGQDTEFFTDNLGGTPGSLQIAAIDRLDASLHQQIG